MEDKKGVLVEAMTYRVGHHSTSDDSSKYRPAEEVKEWMTVGQCSLICGVEKCSVLMFSSDNPIHRFRNFLVQKGWWSEAEDVELVKKHRADVLAAFKRAEKLPKPKLGEMFTNVWVTGKGGKQPEVIVSTYTISSPTTIIGVSQVFLTRGQEFLRRPRRRIYH